MYTWKTSLPPANRKTAGIPVTNPPLWGGVVNSCLAAANVVGVPAGPVQLVNVHVTVPKFDGSACATATVVAAIAETHARTTRNGLSRFIFLSPSSIESSRPLRLQPPVVRATLSPALK